MGLITGCRGLFDPIDHCMPDQSMPASYIYFFSFETSPFALFFNNANGVNEISTCGCENSTKDCVNYVTIQQPDFDIRTPHMSADFLFFNVCISVSSKSY